MTHIFKDLDEAVDLNSNCSFCGLPKFKVMVTSRGYFLERDSDGKPDYCQWNHSSEIVYQPAADHDETMMIVQGG